jgi:hypothetical protein
MVLGTELKIEPSQETGLGQAMQIRRTPVNRRRAKIGYSAEIMDCNWPRTKLLIQLKDMVVYCTEVGVLSEDRTVCTAVLLTKSGNITVHGTAIRNQVRRQDRVQH